MFPVGRSVEGTRPCPGLYMGLLCSSEECAGFWLVVALAGVNSGNTGHWSIPGRGTINSAHFQGLSGSSSTSFFKYNFEQVLCFLFVGAVPRGYIKLCNDLFILSVWSDVKLWPP